MSARDPTTPLPIEWELPLRAVLDLGAGIAVADPVTRRFVRANRRFCEMLGYTEEELRARTIADVTYVGDRDPTLQVLDSAIVGADTYRYEKRYVRKDGEVVWAFVTGQILRDPAGQALAAVATVIDITERKRAEARLEALLGSIGDHLASCDRQWRYTYVNDRAARVLGKRKEELLGRSIWELFPDAVGSQYYRELHRALAEQRVIRSEHYYAPFDAWFENHIYPSADGITVFASDITARKRAEGALRESQERFARFMRNLPGLAWIKDGEGRYVFVNDAAERAFGVPRAQLYGRRDLEVFPSETARAFMRNDEQALCTEAGVVTTETLRHPDGTVHESIVSKFPIPAAAGSPALVGGIAIDVTELRRAEAALRASEERFQLVARATNDSLWDLDVPSGRLWWSEAVHSQFGYSGAEAAPPSFAAWRERVHPDDRERVLAGFDRALRTGEATWKDEYRYRRADGTYAYVLDRGYVIRDAEARAVRVVGAITDLSERKRAEEALEEADRRKDEFLATLAHELRNPLAPIRNAVEVLRLPSASAAELRWAREVVGRQTQQLSRLVDDLLDVSRITHGAIELRRERVLLSAVVERALETSRPTVDAAGHRLTVRLPAEPVELDVDPTRLAQVLSNLVQNAAKYTDRGGAIELSGDAAGSELVVRVRDDGMGIPADMLRRIFAPFAQGVAPAARAQGGLGIGLTIARRLAELHGGTLEARSEGPGRGSEFTLRLPAVVRGAAAGRREPARRPDARRGPARRILVVDDNHDAAESLAVYLSMHGHDVRIKNDGPSALEEARARPPEWVLLDLGMPGMTGYELARRLRADPRTSGTCLVAISGWGQADDRRRTVEAGIAHHLVKPVDPAAVLRLIDRGD